MRPPFLKRECKGTTFFFTSKFFCNNFQPFLALSYVHIPYFADDQPDRKITFFKYFLTPSLAHPTPCFTYNIGIYNIEPPISPHIRTIIFAGDGEGHCFEHYVEET